MVETGSSDSLRVEVENDSTIVVQGDIDIAGGPVLEETLVSHEITGTTELFTIEPTS